MAKWSGILLWLPYSRILARILYKLHIRHFLEIPDIDAVELLEGEDES